MKLIIAGSRGITSFNVVAKGFELSRAEGKVAEVVSGAARGVDTLGEELARSLGLPVKRFPADWKKYGKAAGMIRNRAMAEYADALLAIFDGSSPGTAGMIQIIQEVKKPFYVHRPPSGPLFNDAWVDKFWVK